MSAVVVMGVGLSTAAVAVSLGPTVGRRPRRGRDVSGGAASVPRTSRAARSGPTIALAAIVGVVAAAVLGPALTLVGAVLGLIGRAAVFRGVRRRIERAKERTFPDLLDLFRIAVAAGHPVARCVEVVADRAPVPHRPALIAARDRVRRGGALHESLVGVGPDLGPLGPALVDLLASGHRTGAPLGPPLERLATTARHRRARAAEAEARRLPVTMLFPLVGCILPAFVLLAVVPLLVASFGSLQH